MSKQGFGPVRTGLVTSALNETNQRRGIEMEIQTLKPGLLVTMETSIKGNVQYWRETIELATLKTDGALEEEWNTRKRVADPQEHDAAIKLRTKMRGLILSATDSPFAGGFLVTEDKRDEIEAAIAEGQQLADEFNARATYSRIHFNVFVARIAQDDVLAVERIAATLRELIADMQVGIKTLDPQAVRDSANKAQQMTKVLTPEASARMQVAIDVARNAATRIKKAGDAVVKQIDREAIRRIDRARTSFLEYVEADIEAHSSEVEYSGRSVELLGV